jgi:hypothetical protein
MERKSKGQGSGDQGRGRQAQGEQRQQGQGQQRYESGAGQWAGESSSEPGVSNTGFSGQGGSERGSMSGSESGKKFRISCAEAGKADCSLEITGTEDEVIACAVSHSVDAHGMKDDSKLREDLRGLIKEVGGQDMEGEESEGLDSRSEQTSPSSGYGQQQPGQSGSTGLPA